MPVPFMSLNNSIIKYVKAIEKAINENISYWVTIGKCPRKKVRSTK